MQITRKWPIGNKGFRERLFIIIHKVFYSYSLSVSGLKQSLKKVLKNGKLLQNRQNSTQITSFGITPGKHYFKIQNSTDCNYEYELTTGIDDIKVLAWAWARITKNAGHCYKGATWFIITYELYFVCSVYNFAWYVRCFSFTTDGNLWPTIVCSVNLEYFWRCTAQMHDIIFTHVFAASVPHIYKQIWSHYPD